MKTERRVYGYYPVRREPEVYHMIETTNKTITKIGFCVGLLGVAGYALYKKVNSLAKDVKKMKEETGK